MLLHAVFEVFGSHGFVPMCVCVHPAALPLTQTTPIPPTTYSPASPASPSLLLPWLLSSVFFYFPSKMTPSLRADAEIMSYRVVLMQ
jgi:hypothetical protein